MPMLSRRSTVVSLLLSCHPLPAAAMTVGLTLAAALTGRTGRECLLVAATVAAGQLTVGWLNDVVDADRDRLAGRRDKPVALGWISARTVLVATGVATVAVIPLSLANGTAAGLAHLVWVLSAWAYNLQLKRTVLSWLPYVVGFGALPAFLSYGGWGLGSHGRPPSLAITVATALFAVGVHFLNALPDLVEDDDLGLRHLPLRIALLIGARRLLRISTVFTVLAAAAVLVAALTGGVRR